MKPENLSISIERVENGWVIHAFGSYAARRDGFCSEGTMVAATPDRLCQIIGEWASKQTDAAKQ
jgi:hypothetical protein